MHPGSRTTFPKRKLPRSNGRVHGVAIAVICLLTTGCVAVSTQQTPTTATTSPSGSSTSPTTDAQSTADDPLLTVNRERGSAGVQELVARDALDSLARLYAEEGAGSGSPRWETTFQEDMAAAGYPSGHVMMVSGASPHEAFADWLADIDDRNVLLDPDYASVGLASVADADGRVTTVVVLGYRADESSLPLNSLGAAEALDLTNAERARNSLPALTLSNDLNRAAQGQADHQAAILTMTHDGNGGLENRLQAVGYRSGAENVATGQRSIAEVVQGWIDSPGHHANIVSSDMREMGFAVAVGTDGRSYFAQVFGTR